MTILLEKMCDIQFLQVFSQLVRNENIWQSRIEKFYHLYRFIVTIKEK